MPRNLSISRDEAEWLVDLLEDCDPAKTGNWRHNLASEIRSLFGMVSLEEEHKSKTCMSNKKKIRKKRGALLNGDINAKKEHGIIKFKLDPERDARIEREKQEDRDREENSKATLLVREWFMKFKSKSRTLGEVFDEISKLIDIIETTISNPVIKAKIIKDVIYPGTARLHEANVLESFTQLAVADCGECEWGGMVAFRRSVWEKEAAVMDCPECKHTLMQRKGDIITESEARKLHERLQAEEGE